MKKYSNKRYLIVVPNNADVDKAIKQIDLVKTIVSDYTIQCEDIQQLKQFLNKKYHAFLKYPVSDWETFYYLRELEVSDIYIDGQLGFQIKKLGEGKGNIKIRVSPTISPNASIATRKPISSFYIRPEDLSLYKDVIDVIDFKVQTQDLEDTLFSIYKRGSFIYNIDALIKDLPQGINNLLFKEEFAKHRLNCGQKCKIPGYSCHHCETYFNITQQLNNLI